MPTRSTSPLQLPKIPIARNYRLEEEDPAYLLARQTAERVAYDHLAELRKRVRTSVYALPKDLQHVPRWHRVWFDGENLDEAWAQGDGCYWIEPRRRYDECLFSEARVQDCRQHPPPLGWARWLYFRANQPVFKSLNIQWDVREGEIMDFFAEQREPQGRGAMRSLIQAMGAADVIEECRNAPKRLSKEEYEASPLQLCVHWDPKPWIRKQLDSAEGSKLVSAQQLGALRFAENGCEVPCTEVLTTANMMLLSKHEIHVLARRPHLAQFLIEQSDTWHWHDVNEFRCDLEEQKELERRYNRWGPREPSDASKKQQKRNVEEDEDMDDDVTYQRRDVRVEIEPVQPTEDLWQDLQNSSLSKDVREAYEFLLRVKRPECFDTTESDDECTANPPRRADAAQVSPAPPETEAADPAPAPSTAPASGTIRDRLSATISGMIVPTRRAPRFDDSWLTESHCSISSMEEGE